MQFLTLGVRQHGLIVGPRGSGKTAIVRYILNEHDPYIDIEGLGRKFDDGTPISFSRLNFTEFKFDFTAN